MFAKPSRPRSAALLSMLGLAVLAATRPQPPRPRTTTNEARTTIVRMTGSERRASFEPSRVVIHAGDAVEFVVVSGPPHNVAFDTTALSGAAREKLREAVHDPMLPFAGPLLLKPGDSYTVSFAGMPAGSYPFFCMPHVALGMRGVVVVQ